MRKSTKIQLIAAVMVVGFSFSSYSVTMWGQDKTTENISAEEAKKVESKECVESGSVTFTGSTEDANASGWSESGKREETTTTTANTSTGEAKVTTPVVNENSTTVTKHENGATTTVTVKVPVEGKTDGSVVTRFETTDGWFWERKEYGQPQNGEDPEGSDDADPKNNGDPPSGFVRDTIGLLGEGARIDSVTVYNDDLKVTKVTGGTGEPIGGGEGESESKTGGNSTTTISEYSDGTKHVVTTRRDEVTAGNDFIKFLDAVEQIKTDGKDSLQTVTKKENGKTVTTYVVEEDGEEHNIEYTESSRGTEYEIENLYYQWDMMALENDKEFGNTGRWNLGEKTEVGARKHVFSHTFTNWGGYKVKCDWHYIKHYYHWERYECTHDDGESHTVEYKVYDGDERKIDPVDTWHVDVPLVCTGCPPVRVCVGAGCTGDCADNANYVCDDEHNPKDSLSTNTYTELIK